VEHTLTAGSSPRLLNHSVRSWLCCVDAVIWKWSVGDVRRRGGHFGSEDASTARRDSCALFTFVTKRSIASWWARLTLHISFFFPEWGNRRFAWRCSSSPCTLELEVLWITSEEISYYLGGITICRPILSDHVWIITQSVILVSRKVEPLDFGHGGGCTIMPGCNLRIFCDQSCMSSCPRS